MAPYINKAMFTSIRRVISLMVLFAFITTSVKSPAYAQLTLDPMPRLPAPGVMVHLSPEFTPAYLKGIITHPENALKFDFIIYKGDQPLSGQAKKAEYTRLIKYFLASLAVPDDDQWVNLSPYEKNRIIKENFGKTEMGRDLLAQDYMLKQITASLIYPQDKLGQEFWNKVYVKAYQQFGTTNIPVDTFNKVWIVPDDAEVFEKGNMAYVVKNHLKVMLKEDYLSLNKHNGIEATGNQNKAHMIGSQVVREIVLPALEREVNEGRNFAPLRQVFSGVVLAAWYKRELKESFLSKIYMNKSRLKGVDQDPKNNIIIYQQYLKAFKRGVFNFIKEDVDKYSNETIPRKYFSGGAVAKYPQGAFHRSFASIGQLSDLAMSEPYEDVVEVDAKAIDSDASMHVDIENNRVLISNHAEQLNFSEGSGSKIVYKMTFEYMSHLVAHFVDAMDNREQRFFVNSFDSKEDFILFDYLVFELAHNALYYNFFYPRPHIDVTFLAYPLLDGTAIVQTVIHQISTRDWDWEWIKENAKGEYGFSHNRNGGFKTVRKMAGTGRPFQLEYIRGNVGIGGHQDLTTTLWVKVDHMPIIPEAHAQSSSVVADAGQSSIDKKDLTKGGIDFNSTNLAMVIKRDGKGATIPLAQQDMAKFGNLEGLEPVILKIQSAVESPLLSQILTNQPK